MTQHNPSYDIKIIKTVKETSQDWADRVSRLRSGDRFWCHETARDSLIATEKNDIDIIIMIVIVIAIFINTSVNIIHINSITIISINILIIITIITIAISIVFLLLLLSLSIFHLIFALCHRQQQKYSSYTTGH